MTGINYFFFWLVIGTGYVYIQTSWVVIFFFCHIGSYFPNQGSSPCPLHWEHGVLTTGLPVKAPDRFFKCSSELSQLIILKLTNCWMIFYKHALGTVFLAKNRKRIMPPYIRSALSPAPQL